ncbi:MAG: 50S ribosomal protein L4 [Planctomycetes bacterium]|nr:50S ribosomal protein L4 [Planctomycetota bacterium]
MQTKSWKNGTVSDIEFDSEFLGDIVRVRLLRHAIRMYEMNKRQGTHNTKGRSDLHFRREALFKQKGTGRARVRHASATQCRHGAVAHGPHPRDYSYQMPRRSKTEALRSALLAKFRDGEVTLAADLGVTQAKTKPMAQMLGKLGYQKSCVIVVGERDDNLLLACRNLRRIVVVPASEVNAWHLLHYKNAIITEEAIGQLRERTRES